MEQVGKKLGIKKSSYASYESKYRQPPIERLRQLSHVYGVSVDFILGLTDDRTESQERNIRNVFNQQGLHWDGLPLRDEEIEKLLKMLEDAITRFNENEQSEEGCS